MGRGARGQNAALYADASAHAVRGSFTRHIGIVDVRDKAHPIIYVMFIHIGSAGARSAPDSAAASSDSARAPPDRSAPRSQRTHCIPSRRPTLQRDP